MIGSMNDALKSYSMYQSTMDDYNNPNFITSVSYNAAGWNHVSMFMQALSMNMTKGSENGSSLPNDFLYSMISSSFEHLKPLQNNINFASDWSNLNRTLNQLIACMGSGATNETFKQMTQLLSMITMFQHDIMNTMENGYNTEYVWNNDTNTAFYMLGSMGTGVDNETLERIAQWLSMMKLLPDDIMNAVQNGSSIADVWNNFMKTFQPFLALMGIGDDNEILKNIPHWLSMVEVLPGDVLKAVLNGSNMEKVWNDVVDTSINFLWSTDIGADEETLSRITWWLSVMKVLPGDIMNAMQNASSGEDVWNNIMDIANNMLGSMNNGKDNAILNHIRWFSIMKVLPGEIMDAVRNASNKEDVWNNLMDTCIQLLWSMDTGAANETVKQIIQWFSMMKVPPCDSLNAVQNASSTEDVRNNIMNTSIILLGSLDNGADKETLKRIIWLFSIMKVPSCDVMNGVHNGSSEEYFWNYFMNSSKHFQDSMGTGADNETSKQITWLLSMMNVLPGDFQNAVEKGSSEEYFWNYLMNSSKHFLWSMDNGADNATSIQMAQWLSMMKVLPGDIMNAVQNGSSIEDVWNNFMKKFQPFLALMGIGDDNEILKNIPHWLSMVEVLPGDVPKAVLNGSNVEKVWNDVVDTSINFLWSTDIGADEETLSRITWWLSVMKVLPGDIMNAMQNASSGEDVWNNIMDIANNMLGSMNNGKDNAILNHIRWFSIMKVLPGEIMDAVRNASNKEDVWNNLMDTCIQLLWSMDTGAANETLKQIIQLFSMMKVPPCDSMNAEQNASSTEDVRNNIMNTSIILLGSMDNGADKDTLKRIIWLFSMMKVPSCDVMNGVHNGSSKENFSNYFMNSSKHFQDSMGTGADNETSKQITWLLSMMNVLPGDFQNAVEKGSSEEYFWNYLMNSSKHFLWSIDNGTDNATSIQMAQWLSMMKVLPGGIMNAVQNGSNMDKVCYEVMNTYINFLLFMNNGADNVTSTQIAQSLYMMKVLQGDVMNAMKNGSSVADILNNIMDAYINFVLSMDNGADNANSIQITQWLSMMKVLPGIMKAVENASSIADIWNNIMDSSINFLWSMYTGTDKKILKHWNQLLSIITGSVYNGSHIIGQKIPGLTSFSGALYISYYKWFESNLALSDKDSRCLAQGQDQLLSFFVGSIPLSSFDSLSENQSCSLVGEHTWFKKMSYHLKPNQAKSLLKKLGSGCKVHLDKYGGLVCFLTKKEVGYLDSDWDRNVVLHQLSKCRNDVHKIYKELGKMKVPYSVETIKTLGNESSSMLDMEALDKLNSSTVLKVVASLGEDSGWSRSQASNIVKKAMSSDKGFNTSESLVRLGSLLKGVDSKVFSSMSPAELKKASKTLSKQSSNMSPTQRKAIVSQMMSGSNVSEMMENLSGKLIQDIPLKKLSSLQTVDASVFRDKKFSPSQAMILVPKFLKKDNISLADLKTLGSANRGLSCRLMKKLDYSTLLEQVTYLAQTSSLSRSQMSCLEKLLHKKLTKDNKNYFKKMTKNQIYSIPPSIFSRFPPEDIRNIPKAACLALITRFGETDPTVLPKHSPKRSMVMTTAANCLNFTNSEVIDLGYLVCEVNVSIIPKEHFKSLLPKLHACGTLSKEKADAVAEKLQIAFGDLGNWTTVNIGEAGPLLSTLTSDQLSSLQDNVLVGGALVNVFTKWYPSESLVSLGEFQRSWNLNLVMRAGMSRLFPSKSKPKPKRTKRAASYGDCSEVQPLNSTMISQLKMAIRALTSNELYCMSNSTFKNSVDDLGAVTGFIESQRLALLARAKEAWGPHVDQWTEVQISSLCRLAVGLTSSELSSMTFSSIDTVSSLGKATEWTSEKGKIIVESYLNQTSSTLESLSSTGVTGLGHLICFLTPEQIGRLNTDAYRNSASNVGENKCDQPVLQALKNKSIEAFGEINTWSAVTFNEIGVVAAALSNEEWLNVNESLLQHVKPEAIQAMPKEILQEMSVSRLESLGSENAAAITEEQKQGFSEDQKDAILIALGISVRMNNHASATTNFLLEALRASPDKMASILNAEANNVSTLTAEDFQNLPSNISKEQISIMMYFFNEHYDSLNRTHLALYEVVSASLNRTSNGTFWLDEDNMGTLGRFLLFTPKEELSRISPSEACKFIRSNENVFREKYSLPRPQAEVLLRRLKPCIKDTNSLGLLNCYLEVDNVTDFESNDERERLMNALRSCNNDVHELNSHLFRGVLEKGGASSFNLDQLEQMNDSVVLEALDHLGNARGWSNGNAKVLVDKMIAAGGTFSTSDSLVRLGSLLKGVDSKVFASMSPAELKKASKTLAMQSSNLSPTQRKAIVSQMMTGSSISEVVKSLRGDLIQEVPLKYLSGLDTVNASFFTNKTLNTAQALALVPKFLKADKISTADLRSLGSSAYGLSCELMNKLDGAVLLEQITYLDQTSTLSRNQMLCLTDLLHANLTKDDANYFQKMTKKEINSIPPAIWTLLPMDEILSTPNEECPTLTSRLGEADPTVLPKSSTMRFIFQIKAMSCLDFTKPEVLKLGFLVCDIYASQLSSIPNEHFRTLMAKLHACGTLSNEKAAVVKTKLQSIFGNLGSWTNETIIQVGPLLSVFTSDQLSALPHTSEVGQALVDVIKTHTASESATSLPEFQRSWDLTLLENPAFSRLFGTGSPNSRKKRATQVDCNGVQAPNSTMISDLKELSSQLTLDDLSCMSNSTFKNSLDILAAVTGFTDSQRLVLLEKVKVWKPHVQEWTEPQIYSLGRLIVGLTPVDLARLKLSSIDTVSNLANITGWNSTQCEAIVTAYLIKSESTMPTLSSTQLSGLGPFLCCQSKDKIALLSKTAYSEAAYQVGKAGCQRPQLEAFVQKAKEAFGEMSKWNSATLQEIGSVLGGSSADDLKQLKPTVMPYFPASAISELPINVFKTLSAEQLKSLSVETAGTVTAQQKAALSPEQTAALNTALNKSLKIIGNRADSMSASGMVILLMVTLTIFLLK
uniref:uncharacterized protein n=1 Tax=Myxine glutinosa TaxID=7769 RepID=UPI00358F8DC2